MKTLPIQFPQQDLSFSSKRVFLAVIGSYLLLTYTSDPAFAVTVEALKEPIKEFKTEVFDWMAGAKILGLVGGLVMAIFRFSAAPALTGVGVTAGIHFFDKYLGDGAAGALI